MEQDPAAAHGTGELQNIYNGLEEANSILERFRNRRSNAAAESAMREQQKEGGREREAEPTRWREGRDQVLQEEQQAWMDRATQRLEQVDRHLSENEDAALPVMLDAFSPNHGRTWSDDEDEERSSYSPAPLILDLYDSNDHMPAISNIKRREAVQTRRRQKFVPRALHAMSSVSSTVLAAVNTKPQRCVGWFMELDRDCDGFVSPQQMIDAVLLLPCRLSSESALEFVASIPNTESDDITLSSLWIALQCPDLEHAENDSDGDEVSLEKVFHRMWRVALHLNIR